jgi:hypothetical protein
MPRGGPRITTRRPLARRVRAAGAAVFDPHVPPAPASPALRPPRDVVVQIPDPRHPLGPVAAFAVAADVADPQVALRERKSAPLRGAQVNLVKLGDVIDAGRKPVPRPKNVTITSPQISQLTLPRRACFLARCHAAVLLNCLGVILSLFGRSGLRASYEKKRRRRLGSWPAQRFDAPRPLQLRPFYLGRVKALELGGGNARRAWWGIGPVRQGRPPRQNAQAIRPAGYCAGHVREPRPRALDLRGLGTR